ncbi:hypothetical protein BGZ94_002618, partial [Podila epigama]
MHPSIDPSVTIGTQLEVEGGYQEQHRSTGVMPKFLISGPHQDSASFMLKHGNDLQSL